MTEEKKRKKLIYYLFDFQDRRTYKKYIKEVPQRPIFRYLYTLPLVDLEKITRSIKESSNYASNYNLNVETDTSDTPNFYADETIQISANLQLTIYQGDTFARIFKRREDECKNRLLEELESQKKEEKRREHEKAKHENYQFELESSVKQFQKLYRKTLMQTELEKEKTLEKMSDIFDMHLFANTFSCNQVETTVSKLGEEYCQLIHFYVAHKNNKLEKISNLTLTVGLFDSQNFIYLHECTKRDFNDYLQKNISELSMLEFKDAFDKIWEYILNKWADEQGIGDFTIEEIRADNTELNLFRGQFQPELRDNNLQRLYDYTKDECRKILEI